MLEAPDFEADNATMDEWLKSYLAALDQADPEHEDEEPGMRPSVPCPSLKADWSCSGLLDLPFRSSHSLWQCLTGRVIWPPAWSSLASWDRKREVC